MYHGEIPFRGFGWFLANKKDRCYRLHPALRHQHQHGSLMPGQRHQRPNQPLIKKPFRPLPRFQAHPHIARQPRRQLQHLHDRLRQPRLIQLLIEFKHFKVCRSCHEHKKQARSKSGSPIGIDCAAETASGDALGG